MLDREKGEHSVLWLETERKIKANLKCKLKRNCNDVGTKKLSLFLRELDNGVLWHLDATIVCFVFSLITFVEDKLVFHCGAKELRVTQGFGSLRTVTLIISHFGQILEASSFKTSAQFSNTISQSMILENLPFDPHLTYFLNSEKNLEILNVRPKI